MPRNYILRIRGPADGVNTLEADPGSFALTGADATLTYNESAGGGELAGTAEEAFVTGLVPRFTTTSNLQIHASTEIDITDNSVDQPGTDWFGPVNEGVSITVASDDASVTVNGGSSDTVAANNQGQANFTIARSSSGAAATLTISATGFTTRTFPVSGAESGSSPTLSVVGTPGYALSERCEVTILAEENGSPVQGRGIVLTPSNGWMAVTRPMDVPGVYRQSLSSAYPRDVHVVTDAEGKATFEVVPQMEGVSTDLVFSSHGYPDLTVSDVTPTGSLASVWSAAGLPNNMPDHARLVPIWRDDGSHTNYERHGWESKNQSKARFYTHCSVVETDTPVFPSGYHRSCLWPALSNEGGGTGKADCTDWADLSTYDGNPAALLYWRFTLQMTEASTPSNSPRNWRQGKLSYIYRGDNSTNNSECYPTATTAFGNNFGQNSNGGSTGGGWETKAPIGSDQGAEFTDKINTVVVVEIIFRASSNNVDADDGWIDAWVDGNKVSTDQGTTHTIDGISWRTDPSNGGGIDLANDICGKEFYHNVSGETTAEFTWRLHEECLMGVPVTTNDGTSWNLGGDV